jgi:hypothetical protein
MITAPQLIWGAFGNPAPEGKTGSRYRVEPCQGACATCAAPIDEGVPFTPRRGVAGIDNDTFSGHAEYARFGTHVCMACAWLYGDPKRNNRSVLVVGERGWWPTIVQTIEGRPRWRNAFGEIARADPATPMTGVLSAANPQPRLWPRAQVAACGAPGLYVHIPDRDVSMWTQVDLRRIAVSLAAVDRALAIGFGKFSIARGLWVASDIIDQVGLDATERLEAALAPLRGRVEFTIAVTIA